MNELCADIGYKRVNHVGEQLCGDHVDVVEQSEDSTVVVLADGLGSGVKASILSTLTSKIISTMMAEGLTLEDCVETVELGLPAVISVTPDFATPRIPGMKDILAAGKRPMNVSGADAAPQPTLETVELAAPEKAERNPTIVSASEDGAIDKLVEAVKAAL